MFPAFPIMGTCDPDLCPSGCAPPSSGLIDERIVETGLNEKPKAEGGSPPGLRAGRLARNTAFNLLGYGLPLAFGLASLPFIIRGLGAERFGILSLVWVVLGYFSFLDLGLGRATIRFIADAIGRGEPEEIPEYLWTTALIQLTLSLVGTAVLAILTPVLVARILDIPAALQAEARSAFYLTALSLPVVMISASFRGVLEAAQRFDLVNAVKIPSSSVNYLVPLAALLFWKSLTGIVVLLLIARSLTLVVWVLLSFRLFPVLRRRPALVKKRLRPLFSYGGWATVSSLVGSILENLDRFAIGAMLSVHAVAYYVAPYEAVSKLGILPNSLVTALFPAFSLLGGRRDEGRIRDLFARSVKIVLTVCGTLVVLIILLAPVILKLWLGGDFPARSALAFQLIAAGFLFLSFTYVAFNLLQGVGRTDLPARVHLISLAVYLPLLWAGIKLAGIQGAAGAWLILLGLQAVLLFRSAKRLGLTDAGSLLGAGTGRALLGLAGFGAAGGIVSLFAPAVVSTVAATAAYAPALWWWVLAPEERGWLVRAGRKAIGLRGSREHERA